MGAVYKAKQRSLARDVAIKILPREVGQDPLFRQSFETEARAMAKLNHPNLIGVYDSGTVDGMLYIVMEYVPGKSLYHSSYGKKVDPVQAVQLIQGICAGLGHAHENGIIHRDIKPANILLTPKAEPKIGDFGLARPVESAGSGLLMGTPGYTAPEVMSNPQVADCRSDLFAVGVILYELMTGKRQEAGAPPPSACCACGPSLDQIWRCATHPDPNLRYPNAQAFSKALAEWSTKFKSKGPAVKSKITFALATPPAKTAAASGAGAPPGAAVPPGAGETPGAGGEKPGGAAVAVPQVEFQVKTNWTFIRNLFIIAILIVVIAVVWKQLEVVRAQREKVNRERLEEAASKEAKLKADAALNAKADADRRALAAKNPKPPKNTVVPGQPSPPPEPKVVPPPETPLESLERLRIDLNNGIRTELPIGSIRRGDSDFFYVPKAMTWSDAAWYAERFGGHLPIPTSPEDISWFSQKAPPEAGLWIGAGKSGRNEWSFVNGKPWKLSILPKGIGTHIAVNDLGLVRGFDSKSKHTFLIQWHRDGSNPASLAATLLATRQSLTEVNPTYPPGCETFESRHYLFVSRPITWQAAVELAEKSGGHLAVVSDKTEAGHLAEFAASVIAPDGIWLGASLKGKDWSWVTGEAWNAIQWPQGIGHDKSGTALLVRPDKGWDTQDATSQASGFIIEWSKDREQGAGTQPPKAGTLANPAKPAAGAGNDLALTLRAKELVVLADKKRTEQLAALTRSFAWDLDLWLRSLAKVEQTTWQLHVAKLKAAVRNSRVPTSAIPREAGILLSPQMTRILSDAIAKQEQIDAAFLAEVDKLRATYLAKVKDDVTVAEEAGQTNLATSLRNAFKLASENDAWIRSFGIEPKPVEIPLSKD